MESVRRCVYASTLETPDDRRILAKQPRIALVISRLALLDKRVFRRPSHIALDQTNADHSRPIRTFERISMQDVVTVLTVALLYFGAAKLGFALASTTEQVTAIWPPSGIALTALWLLGYRVWPGIYLGAFVANVTTGEPFLTAAAIAAGNTLTGVLGALSLRRLKFHATLERTRDVCSLVVVALMTTIVSSTLGTTNLVFADIVAKEAFWSVWLIWWIGDTLGILLVAPFLLTWLKGPRWLWRDWKFAEYAALFVLLPIESYIAFARLQPVGQAYSSIVYSAFPFLIWAALRFGQREVVSSSVIVSTIAIWGAVHDRGPFIVGSLDERLIALDTFTGVTLITALFLGAVTAERRQSQQRLRRARDELERRVKQRTAELEAANEELYELSYSMSHDLRAPLRAVNAFSQLLADKHPETFDADGRRYLDSVAKNSRLMSGMIDDYLRLLKLRHEPIQIKPLDMNSLTREIVDDLRAQHQPCKSHFEVRELPAAAGDDLLIRQVWFNLLSNAVKFARERERPRVEIGGNVCGQEALYYVKDNGVGFDMQWAHQLFKVFQRFHPRRYEGAGIGLATVARIVQRHGGRVYAEGSVDNGATFYFTLPRRLPA